MGRLVRQHMQGTRTHARASTHACTPTMHTPKHISTALHKHDHCTFLPLHTDLCVCLWQRAGRRGGLWPLGFAGHAHGVEVRGRRFDARDHCEGYNHLHMKLLGALQLLYNLVAWAQWRHVLRPIGIALRAMAFRYSSGRGCQRASLGRLRV